MNVVVAGCQNGSTRRDLAAWLSHEVLIRQSVEPDQTAAPRTLASWLGRACLIGKSLREQTALPLDHSQSTAAKRLGTATVREPDRSRA